MKELLEQFSAWLQENYPAGHQDLNPPATEEELKQLEETPGFALPQDLIDLLKVHNGQGGNAGWLLEGQEFLSSERIADEWMIWKGLHDSGEFSGDSSEPQPGIKNDWWNPRWLPFTYNGCGDHYCVDTDPDNGGVSGQVITMWHDAGERELLSVSLKDWFTNYVAALKNGDFVYSDDYGSIVSKDDV